MNILFVCGKARMRSPTAADIVSAWPGFSSDFAGLSRDADERLSTEHLDWSDIIVVMENRQKKRLLAQFPDYAGRKSVVALGVPDKYEYMQPELVELLQSKLRSVLNL